MNILDPVFLSHVVSKKIASAPPPKGGGLLEMSFK